MNRNKERVFRGIKLSVRELQEHLVELFDIPEALPYFVTPKAVEEDSPVLQYLSHWAPCAIADALEFLTPAYKGHHRVMAYVLRVMETYPPESVTFFMPQLIQSLRYDQKVRASQISLKSFQSCLVPLWPSK